MALLTNLKTYREKYNLKQADLAELVGVRRETIVNLERGKYNPSLSWLWISPGFFTQRLRNYFSIRMNNPYINRHFFLRDSFIYIS